MVGPSAPGWVVFLSSTIKDLKEFRSGVRQVLQKAGMACFPSEQWVSSFDDTVARCQQRFSQSNGFVLLLGHWYGSVPPGS